MSLGFSFFQTANLLLITLSLFILIIGFFLLGYAVQLKRRKSNPDFGKGTSGKSNVLIGLLSFLLAFTFGMANERHDRRRDLAVEEANDIGKAYLRTKMLPDSVQEILKPAFKQYLEERIAYSTITTTLTEVIHHYERADSIGRFIFLTVANQAKYDKLLLLTSELVPGINEMIDITTVRRASGEAVIPDTIMFFLFALTFCAAFLLGFESPETYISWIILVIFALMMSITIYMILDLDRARSGLIDIRIGVQKLIELRELIR
jgi:hypothetical protein